MKLWKIISVAILAIVVVATPTYYQLVYVPSQNEAATWDEWKSTIIVGTTLTYATPDPSVGYQGLDHHALPLYVDNLWWGPADEAGKISNMLVESYAVKNEMINGTKSYYIDVKLREGLHFNDGTEITVDDVIFSIKRRMSMSAASVGTIKWIFDYAKFGNDTWTAVGKYGLKMRIKTSFPLVTIALNGMSCEWGAVVSREAVERYGEGINIATYGTSGPLIMTKCIPQEQAVFEVRYNYTTLGTGGWVQGMGKADTVWPPKWKKLIIRTYADTVSLALALKSGEIDFDWGSHSLAEIAALKTDPNIVVNAIPGANSRRLCLSFAFPPLDNLKVRKAIVLALDPSENIKTVYRGLAEPAYSPVHPNYPYYIPVFQDMYSLHGNRTQGKLNQAKALLAEAGYSTGFEVTYAVTDIYGTIDDEKADALIIQKQLADIGIKVNIQVMDQSTFKAMKGEGKLVITMDGFYPDFPDAENDVSEMVSVHGRYYSWLTIADTTKYPEFRYNDMVNLMTQAETLWDANIAPLDNKAREDNFKMQQQISAECVYNIPYFYTQGFLCYRSYLKGFNPSWFYMNIATPGLLAAYKEIPANG